jgi:hypothetical protein
MNRFFSLFVHFAHRLLCALIIQWSENPRWPTISFWIFSTKSTSKNDLCVLTSLIRIQCQFCIYYFCLCDQSNNVERLYRRKTMRKFYFYQRITKKSFHFHIYFLFRLVWEPTDDGKNGFSVGTKRFFFGGKT